MSGTRFLSFNRSSVLRKNERREDLMDQPATRERRQQEIILILLAIPAAALGIVFMYFIGQDALVGRNSFQFFADSNTYHDIYSGYMSTPDGFIDVSYNFLGPLLILTMLGGNVYFVVIINIVIFIISIIIICRVLDLNPLYASAVQFISPLTVFSLLSVNKEILIFPVLALLLSAYRSHSILAIVSAILVSLLARWQLTVFCITLTGIFFVRKKNPYLILIVLLLAISTAYYLAQGFIEPVLRSVELSTSMYVEGSGLFEALNAMQDKGLYFLAAPAKSAHLMFALGLNLKNIVNPIIVYNDQIIGSFCLMNIVLISILIIKRRISPRNDLMMISFVYFVVFALTPVYAPRYFYPVTVLWGLVIAGGWGEILPRERSKTSGAAPSIAHG